jgi:hypothetical protein
MASYTTITDITKPLDTSGWIAAHQNKALKRWRSNQEEMTENEWLSNKVIIKTTTTGRM